MNQLKHGKKISPTRLQEEFKRAQSPNGYAESSEARQRAGTDDRSDGVSKITFDKKTIALSDKGEDSEDKKKIKLTGYNNKS